MERLRQTKIHFRMTFVIHEYSRINYYIKQVCLAVAGNIAMTTKSNVVYIDSGCGFNSTRLTQMLAAKGLNNEVIQCTLQHLFIPN